MSRLEEQITKALNHTSEYKNPSVDLFENILYAMDHIDDRNNKGYRYIKRSLCAAAVLIIMIGMLITSAFISPAMAEVVRNIPVIGSIFEVMGDNGLKDAEKLGLVSPICQSVEDQGVRITINDVLYDDARIVVSFKEECKGEFKNFLNINNDILIDGKHAPGFGMGISHRKSSEGVYIGLLNIDIGDSSNVDDGISSDPEFFTGNIPDEFILGFHIGEIEGVKGTWNFEIPVSKMTSKKMTVKFKPNISRTYKGVTHTLTEVMFAPSCVALSFCTEPFAESGIGSYRVYDDKGKELEAIDGGYIEAPQYLPVKTVPKSLTIVPYTSESKTERIDFPKQFPVTISQGELGDVTIQKIEFLPDRTLIYYDFTPKTQAKEPNRIKIGRKEALDNGNVNYFIEGFPKGPGKKLKDPEKAGENAYVQEYKAIDTDNDLFIEIKQSVTPKPIKEYEITVPLDDPWEKDSVGIEISADGKDEQNAVNALIALVDSSIGDKLL